MSCSPLILSLRDIQQDKLAEFSPLPANEKHSAERGEKAVSFPILSRIIPLPEQDNYVLLQVGGMDSAFQLLIERGEENEVPIHISLNKEDIAYKHLPLKKRIDWRLASLKPGSYSLYFNTTSAMQFSLVL